MAYRVGAYDGVMAARVAQVKAKESQPDDPMSFDGFERVTKNEIDATEAGFAAAGLSNLVGFSKV